MRQHALDYTITDSGRVIIVEQGPSAFHLSISTETASGPLSFSLKLEIENSPCDAETAPTAETPNDSNGPSERYANTQRRKEHGYGQEHSQPHAETPLIGKKQQPYGSNDSAERIPLYASSWYPKSTNQEPSTLMPSSTRQTISHGEESPDTGNKDSNPPNSSNQWAQTTSPSTSLKISINLNDLE